MGTVMAISGAAANPNSGYHTSGPMAFLLTVFDARLGWWLGNPRFDRESKKPGPSFAWLYLFAELFGQTTSRSRFVNVSDGGHFENLGLYELVRRRCRYIIIGDAEQDADLTFEGLGGAVRKCRADFGVEISINPRPLRLKDGNSTAHCVIGTIRYPEREPGKPAGLYEGTLSDAASAGEPARGWLLYLKASVTGDEPADVLEYKARNKEFPHQPTSDQFFSESQFESYRRLGLHVVKDAFAGIESPDTKSGSLTEMLRVFQQLTLKWYTPLPVTDEAASRLADGYSHLMRTLGEKRELHEIATDLLPEFKTKDGEPAPAGVAMGAVTPQAVSLRAAPTAEPDVTAGRVTWLEAIQLMQNVHAEFHLELLGNQLNPRNRGWMNVFRRWVSSETFGDVWGCVNETYNPVFRKFIEELRDDEKKRPGQYGKRWPDAL
jgi:hypothetical protein